MKKKFNLFLILFLSSLLLCIIFLFAKGLTNDKSVTSKSGFTRVGEKAPDFEFILINNSQKFILSENFGKSLVINFWASWCPPCREESELLEKTYKEFNNQNVHFIGVNIQDTLTEAKSYIDQYKITYPNGMDTDGKISIDYGVIGLPVTFFVNKEGIIVTRWVGAITEEQLHSNISKITK
ncbi:MAG: hypothetical protein CL758_04345 [Chloroflexi bacterium]|nr:hypothetical protein [Chloroflexota bacterium]|tara:strand:+ start:21922 stop:22464 length:543 start_codon:yes stop_codon:yes gene_type:complete